MQDIIETDKIIVVGSAVDAAKTAAYYMGKENSYNTYSCSPSAPYTRLSVIYNDDRKLQ